MAEKTDIDNTEKMESSNTEGEASGLHTYYTAQNNNSSESEEEFFDADSASLNSEQMLDVVHNPSVPDLENIAGNTPQVPDCLLLHISCLGFFMS